MADNPDYEMNKKTVEKLQQQVEASKDEHGRLEGDKNKLAPCVNKLNDAQSRGLKDLEIP